MSLENTMNHENKKPPVSDPALESLPEPWDWDDDSRTLKVAYSRDFKSDRVWDVEQGTSKRDDEKKKTRRCALGGWIRYGSRVLISPMKDSSPTCLTDERLHAPTTNLMSSRSFTLPSARPVVRVSRLFYDFVTETFDSLKKRNEDLDQRLDSKMKRRFQAEYDLRKTEDQPLKREDELLKAQDELLVTRKELAAARIEVLRAGEQQWALEEKLYAEYQRRVEAQREADRLRAQIKREECLTVEENEADDVRAKV
ncbi:hypothetical protein VTN02DRAFT_5791 [Thermoascus thermophilus]